MAEATAAQKQFLSKGVKQISREQSLPNIEQFLLAIEKRAYAVAYSGLGNRDDALDAIQDAMFQLVKNYSDKTENDWRALFYRILHNKIHDIYRKRKLHNALFGWLPLYYKSEGDQDKNDPFSDFADPLNNSPETLTEQERQVKALQKAVGRLPRRQREAFVLRFWEGLSSKETAKSMACSEGSVKTHYARAMESLRQSLEE